MKTLAIVSRKGGAGKTTIALHLAVSAEELGFTVAVFDLDPQASATIWGDRRGDSSPAVVAAQAPRLASLLTQAREQGADLVILDTAPHADSIASDAAAHADAVLIPCRPSTLDLDAIGASVRLATNAGKPAFVVTNAAHPQGEETAQMREALEKAGVSVSPVVLYQRKAFANYLQEGRTAQEREPKGKAAREIQDLTSWICKQVTLSPKNLGNKVTRKENAA
jgi:chromosome partitioning protein